jgi:hypothetical protein
MSYKCIVEPSDVYSRTELARNVLILEAFLPLYEVTVVAIVTEWILAHGHSFVSDFMCRCNFILGRRLNISHFS